MKILLFWLLAVLNLLALGICVIWVISHKSYESVVVAITISANLIGLVYAKPHWTARSPHTIVTQSGNVAGGDIAAGSITKGGEPPRAA